MLLLQRLQTTVATAWDGNLLNRGSQIDPDKYAVEVMNAERRRLTFQDKLSEVVDALAALVPCTDPPGPLFVVSLDDVDLNPLRCLEALRLLHLLAVPRVFTIVLGNLCMVELALHLKYSGEFSALVGYHSSQNLISMAASDVATQVRVLVSNTMRKLLPPAQRIRLPSLTRAETLDFRPLGMQGDQVPMRALLDRCPVVIGTEDPPTMAGRRIDSLRDFLLYPSPEGLDDKTDIKEDDLKHCTYTASHFLSMSPRRAADWWFLLKEVESGAQTDKKPGTHDPRNEKFTEITDLLGRHCRSVIDEEPTLTSLIHGRFRRGLKRASASGGWELSFAVSSIPETGLRTFLSVQDKNGRYPFRRYIVTQQGDGWRLQQDLGNTPSIPPTAVDPFELAEEVRKRLDRSFSAPTTWGLILLYDLLILGPDWEVSDKFWIRRPLELWGFSQWNITKIKPIWIAWPVPGFLSFWGHDIFLNYWNAAVKHILKTRLINGEQASIEACVYAWLDAGAAVLVREKPLWNPETQLTPEDWKRLINRLAEASPQPVPPSQHETLAGSATEVKTVAQIEEKTVAQVADRMDPRGYGAAEWLSRLPYFLWPAVSGIRPEITNHFFEDRHLCTAWGKYLPAIDQRVNDILEHPKEKPEKALNRTDTAKLRRDWRKYQKSIASAATAMAQRTSDAEPAQAPPAKKPRRRR